MNIDFHYYAVKTIALVSGFSEDDAQTIATFSQYVDDYNPEEYGKYNTIPETIINKPKSKLVMTENEQRNYVKLKLVSEYYDWKGTYLPNEEQKVDTYFNENESSIPNFRRIKTGFTVSECAMELRQKKSVAPFHFIAYNSNKANAKENRFTQPATIGDGSLISNHLEKAKQEYLNSNNTTKKRALMHIGMLLHIFADTYAHAEFSGFNEYCNIAEVSDVRYTKNDNEVPITDKYIEDYIMQQYGVYGMTKRIFAVGHQMVGHLPDYPAIRFKLKFERYPLIKRDNTVIFTEVSMRIFDFLYDIRHEKEEQDTNKNTNKDTNMYKYFSDEYIAAIRDVNNKYEDTYEYDSEENMAQLSKAREDFVNKLKYAFSHTPINTFEESWLVTKKIKGVWRTIFGGSDELDAVSQLKTVWVNLLNASNSDSKRPTNNYEVKNFHYAATDVFAVDNKDIEDVDFYYYNSYAEDILMGLYPEDYIQ